jgi:hypothetical protein
MLVCKNEYISQIQTLGIQGNDGYLLYFKIKQWQSNVRKIATFNGKKYKKINHSNSI